MIWCVVQWRGNVPEDRVRRGLCILFWDNDYGYWQYQIFLFHKVGPPGVDDRIHAPHTLSRLDASQSDH